MNILEAAKQDLKWERIQEAKSSNAAKGEIIERVAGVIAEKTGMTVAQIRRKATKEDKLVVSWAPFEFRINLEGISRVFGEEISHLVNEKVVKAMVEEKKEEEKRKAELKAKRKLERAKEREEKEEFRLQRKAKIDVFREDFPEKEALDFYLAIYFAQNPKNDFRPSWVFSHLLDQPDFKINKKFKVLLQMGEYFNDEEFFKKLEEK